MSKPSIVALSNSPSFMQHLARTLVDTNLQTVTDWPAYLALPDKGVHVLLLHSGLTETLDKETILKLTSGSDVRIGIAADAPTLTEALDWIPVGIMAYFNSYMADIHYQHMLQALQLGQSWFAPQVLQGLVGLARQGMARITPDTKPSTLGLDKLTPREQEIAQAIGAGMKNKQIAEHLGITERTVKAHLSNIFEKMAVKDRLQLAIKIKGEETD